MGSRTSYPYHAHPPAKFVLGDPPFLMRASRYNRADIVHQKRSPDLAYSWLLTSDSSLQSVTHTLFSRINPITA
ncbi:Uncharacterised protein [Vibrio cholerae]|nr:Uncharacterised protein [Vibrio cholerae]